MLLVSQADNKAYVYYVMHEDVSMIFLESSKNAATAQLKINAMSQLDAYLKVNRAIKEGKIRIVKDRAF